MAEDQKGMVPGVNVDTLANLIRQEISAAFGRPVDEFTNSACLPVYRELVRKLVRKARLQLPLRRIKGTLCSDFGMTWIEPSDGTQDVALQDLAEPGELIELILVEPER